MKWLLFLAVLAALVSVYEEPEAARNSPYWQHALNYVDSLGDTLFGQQADTTDAIDIDNCVGVGIHAQGHGSDSVQITVQSSLDGLHWAAFGTAIALQNWATGYPELHRSLTTVDVAASPTSQGNAAVSRYIRLIIKNNCHLPDTTATDADTLTAVVFGVTCGK